MKSILGSSIKLIQLDSKFNPRLIRRCLTWKNLVYGKKNFGTYKIVKPSFVSEKSFVPENIARPLYAQNLCEVICREPEVKNSEDIMKMRKSCYLAKFILEALENSVKIGVTTDELDKIAHKLCLDYLAYPSPLDYQGFPKSICTSINNVACHGIPDDRPLEDGDIINVDITVYLNGFHGDCSTTFLVGNVDKDGIRLVQATEKCLKDAISICRPGEYFSSIGAVIEETSRKYGFKVVPCFTGHGIGSYFHGPPDIYHCYNEYPGKMQAGMTFTIEPLLTQGDEDIVILEDGWTAITLDQARTAQCEHTVLITSNSAEILTCT